MLRRRVWQTIHSAVDASTITSDVGGVGGRNCRKSRRRAREREIERGLSPPVCKVHDYRDHMDIVQGENSV